MCQIIKDPRQHKTFPWKPQFFNEPCISNKRCTARSQRIRKSLPKKDAGDQEQGVMRDLDIQDKLEDKPVDHREQKRIEHRPDISKESILIADRKFLLEKDNDQVTVVLHKCVCCFGWILLGHANPLTSRGTVKILKDYTCLF